MKRALASFAVLLLVAGCKPDAAPGGGGASSGPKADIFAEAAKSQEEGEGPFIEPARPFLTAVASRDYAKVYAELSSHAKAKIFPHQFVPQLDDKQPKDDKPVANLTAEQCAEWMKKMEATLGVPEAVQHVYVQTIEPEVLAGKGDRFDVMLAIGGMPAEIPANIRKASIRAQVRCQLPEDDVKKIAADLKISEEQVRSGKWPENDKGYDPDERPYLNVKFVLVEEEGKLKVGYFEFMPPSILD
jgi:hypothetical protein